MSTSACGKGPLGLPSVLAVLLILALISAVQAAPEGGVVRAGSAQIVQQGAGTIINQTSQRAVIDWRSFGINSAERVQFSQPSASSATLNRVTGGQVSVILGRLDANGQVLLINPNGIVFGRGAQVNVGSLIASAANLSNDNFMRGRLIFDQPGKPGASVVNSGTITAAEGGLIALVAPHVRNDGLIQAKLGKVTLGAADTFTIDLYGDGLINLALSEASLSLIKGGLIEQAGGIGVEGGQAVLVTAQAAKGMLDSLINMSGAILADSATQEGGRIVLLARGGSAQVSGSLSARGTTGGQIEVLGDKVQLTSTASLKAEGINGGGTIHVGGAYQGAAGTYTSQDTRVEQGANISASATTKGDGGEVIVWSDGNTDYAGSILARGGAQGGNGGAVEVSGKGVLSFNGLVDAGAAYGRPGTLLLDPYDLTIGLTEAALINKVLRTGTSTTASATHDIFVNSIIDGRGRIAGAGITFSAGNSINVNDYVITYNGPINLLAGTGTVTVASGKAVYAGSGPINVQSGGTMSTGAFYTTSTLTFGSTMGSVNLDYPLESSIGNLVVQAAADVNINQPIISLNDGNSVGITAANNINVNAQVEGRPAYGVSPNGSVVMTAGQDISLNKSIIANAINLTATTGTIAAPTMKAGTVAEVDGIPQGDGLFSGTGPISVTAGGALSSGIYVTTGPVSIRSTGGNVNIDTKLAEILGNVSITADAGSVSIDKEIANIRSGRSLTITAGTDINQNSQIDALNNAAYHLIDPIPGGSVIFNAGTNINLNRDLATYNGPVNLAATNGTLNIAWNATEGRTYRVQAGSAPITVSAGGDLTTGTAVPATLPAPDPAIYSGMTFLEKQNFIYSYIADQLKSYVALFTTGKLSLTSTAGDITVDAPFSKDGGEVALTAADQIVVNRKVYSNGRPITLIAGAGGIVVNLNSDSYGMPAEFSVGTGPVIDAGTGPLTLRSTGDIYIPDKAGIASGNKLIIDTRGKILQGTVSESLLVPAHTSGNPSEIELTADGGINSFYAGYSPKITATSSGGAIHLGVMVPDQLTICAPSLSAGDIFTGGFLGKDATLNAGRDINLSAVYVVTDLKLTAGRYVDMSALDVNSLNVTAGNNINFNSPGYPAGMEGVATVWLKGGNLTANSTGGGINFSNDSKIHVSDGKDTVLTALGSVNLGVLETLGNLSVTSTAGNITLREDIGAPLIPEFDPAGIGPASVYLNASGNINMQGAKSAGLVTIIAGGTLTPLKGIFSDILNGVNITAGGGALERISGGPDKIHAGPYSFTGSSFGSVPLEVRTQLQIIPAGAPGIAPGPSVAAPNLPLAITALAAQPPDAVNVMGSGVPAASGGNESLSNSEAEALQAAAAGRFGEIIPEEEDEKEVKEKKDNKDIIIFSGGRGVSRSHGPGR